MILAEPPATDYDLNFSLGGIRVRVHPFFWIVSLMFAARGGSKPDEVLIWLLALFVSIVVHEMGHALAFRYYGASSHIVLHGFGGLAIPHGQTWRGTLPDVVISLSGPGAGFVLATFIIVALRAANIGAAVHFGASIFPSWSVGLIENQQLRYFVHDMLYINIYWGLVNLLPVYPLDGGQVSRALFLRYSTGNALRQSLGLSVLVGAAIAFWAFQDQDPYVGLMFGYLAVTSYQQMQSGGYRRW